MNHSNSTTINPSASFEYLKLANDLLNDSITSSKGRDMVIRALDDRESYYEYDFILKNLVRKAGLLPYLNSEFDVLDYKDKIAIEFFKPEKQDEYVFHSMQYKVYDSLLQGKNIILSAPTSMGKSAIIDALLYADIFEKIAIIVPTIALIDETRKRLFKKFRSTYDIISHNIQSPLRDKVVYILTQERFNERKDIENLDIFIIDEFYKLSFKKDFEDERVISLNVALSKLLKISKQFYMIGPSIDEVRGLETIVDNYYFISTKFNTVAVNSFEFNIKPNDTLAKDAALLKILREYNGQTIIYCRSPGSASKLVNTLIESNIGTSSTTEFTKWVGEQYLTDWDYAKAIKNSIGVHHGNLPRAIQQYTVNLFNEGKLRILICTSTIIEGVNTTAENVIIYDNRNGIASIDRFTHNNIKGRAGRMRSHFIGNVFCLESTPPETMESTVVDVPMGTQLSDTSLNLLVGIQEEHLSTQSNDRVIEFLKEALVPNEIIIKNSSYKFSKVAELYNLISTLDESYFEDLVFSRNPNSRGMLIICRALITIEYASLRNTGLKPDEESLKGRLSTYIMAKNFTEYFRKQMLWISENHEDISDGINTELKVIRTLYKHTIPKFLSLLQDIVDHKLKYTDKKCDYGFFISTFENLHLNPNLAVLEEMGVPIQILDKIIINYDSEMNFEDNILLIKNSLPIMDLSDFEMDFLNAALYQN